MNKFEQFFNEHMNEFFSIKNLLIVFLSVLVLILSVGSNHLLHRSDVAYKYIQELEEYIEDNGGLMDTVGSGDAYADYYNY
jgi:hypothetical protein